VYVEQDSAAHGTQTRLTTRPCVRFEKDFDTRDYAHAGTALCPERCRSLAILARIPRGYRAQRKSSDRSRCCGYDCAPQRTVIKHPPTRWLFALSIVLSVCVSHSWAKAEHVVVELKSGPKYRGTLLDLVPGHHVTIEDLQGREITFPRADIKWVQRDAVPPQLRDPNDPEWLLVELKSGAIIHGELVELVPGEHLIVAVGGRNLRFSRAEIKWVDRRVEPDQADLDPDQRQKLWNWQVGRGIQAAQPEPANRAKAQAPKSAPRPAPKADSSEAHTKRDARAREAFIAGREAYAAKRFAEATTLFELSYELSGRRELLYNIGLAAQASAQNTKAIDAFERYLGARPDSEHRQAIREQLTQLRAAAQ
jgi:hypothetical protein